MSDSPLEYESLAMARTMASGRPARFVTRIAVWVVIGLSPASLAAARAQDSRRAGTAIGGRFATPFQPTTQPTPQPTTQPTSQPTSQPHRLRRWPVGGRLRPRHEIAGQHPVGAAWP